MAGKRGVIITAAGVSARFNEGRSEGERSLKVIYHDTDERATLLYQMGKKCSYADRIVIVGGYRYAELENYVKNVFPMEDQARISLVFNPHYDDYASGYSLYLGIMEVLSESEISEVLFVEGDLDVDGASFELIKNCETDMVTYNYEPIFSNKAVVLYVDQNSQFKYKFNTQHGLLSIEEPFQAIMNSGQIWKFRDMEALGLAARSFYDTHIEDTNLYIVQNYLNRVDLDHISVIGINRWTNCNTREDYIYIREGWENESVK